jgi:hypothetical protein
MPAGTVGFLETLALVFKNSESIRDSSPSSTPRGQSTEKEALFPSLLEVSC